MNGAALPAGFRLGIVGAGHLGGALARAFVRRGFDKGNLLIAHRGNPDTRRRLEAWGLDGCIVPGDRLFREADLALLAIRPQDVGSLSGLPGPRGVIASCMAGVPLAALKKLAGARAVRTMFSGPDTIASGRAMATCYPDSTLLRAVFRAAGAAFIPVESEDDVDAFTAGVCLPAPLLLTGGACRPAGEAERVEGAHPVFRVLYGWALGVLSAFEDEAERDGYVRRMITKGGVTEAIVEGVQSGMPLDEALRAGVARARAISREALKRIMDQD